MFKTHLEAYEFTEIVFIKRKKKTFKKKKSWMNQKHFIDS